MPKILLADFKINLPSPPDSLRCQALSTETVPVVDLESFMLECGVLEP